MSDELLPCPFCTEAQDIFCGKVAGVFYVECGKCSGMGPTGGTEAEAISAWKTRAPDTALVEALEETTGICERYAHFLTESLKYADIDLHPYPPGVEQAAIDARAALNKAKAKPPERGNHESPEGVQS